MSNLLRSACVLAWIAVMLSASRSARATPDFPAAMATDLGITCTPQCMVCHTNNNGGAGTITQPFGRQMQQYGLIKYDQASLAAALAECADAGAACSCAGTNDIDAIKACTDPNTSDAGTCNVEQVIYGCTASPASSDERGGRAALAAVAMLVGASLLIRRMRRRAS